MEVEISTDSLDRSRYGPAAVVADYSHILLLCCVRVYRVGRAPLALSPLMPRSPGHAKDANLLNNPNEIELRAASLDRLRNLKKVKMKGQSEEYRQSNLTKSSRVGVEADRAEWG